MAIAIAFKLTNIQWVEGAWYRVSQRKDKEFCSSSK
jgi:hypothetical protein